jgi:hypothetical protein
MIYLIFILIIILAIILFDIAWSVIAPIILNLLDKYIPILLFRLATLFNKPFPSIDSQIDNCEYTIYPINPIQHTRDFIIHIYSIYRNIFSQLNEYKPLVKNLKASENHPLSKNHSNIINNPIVIDFPNPPSHSAKSSTGENDASTKRASNRLPRR